VQHKRGIAMLESGQGDYERVCETPRCGATVGVELESGRTAYHYEGVPGAPEDPNRPLWLCRPCAEEHHDYWDEMWSNVPRY
jgi:hypothetical protein